MSDIDIRIPCDECDLAGNCSYECSMIALRTNLEAEYLNSMQEISIRCRLIANTEEQEYEYNREALKQAREQDHTCAFCYYEDFDGKAYPCSRCVCNMPTQNMWKPKEE